MKVIVVIIAVAVFGTAAGRQKATTFQEFQNVEITDDEQADYANYMATYYPNYTPDASHPLRVQQFRNCRNNMNSWLPDTVGYSVGLTPMCHWTNSEIQGMLNPVVGNVADTRSMVVDERTLQVRTTALPTNFSWVTNGAVSAVKNQGMCGSCYTFAAAAALEGAYQIKHGALLNISTQQYVDCTSSYGDLGCSGGNYVNCWNYNSKSSTLQNLWSCYPYTSGNTAKAGTCNVSSTCSTGASVKSYVSVQSKNETALLQAVAIGPVACAMDASQLSPYTGGIFTGPCSTSAVDHAVTVVGWGTTAAGANYWLVKNSWGTGWGQKGYFQLPRGSNACAISLMCAYPIAN